MGTDRRDRPALRAQIQDALGSFADGPLRERAEALLEALGYRSERHIDVDPAPLDFLNWAETDSGRPLTAKQRALILETWDRVEMVFQYSEDELKTATQDDLFGASATWTRGRAESFVFFAVDLKPGDYTRSKLAAMTRAINRFFPMPVIVFYRHERPGGGVAMTLAVVHRRQHKCRPERDVLEKITLIKDVRVAQPHRAHLDILGELALNRLALEKLSFDRLHVAWEGVLDTEALNRSFYAGLFKWYQRAIMEARFPPAAPVEHQVLRLITRILFIWFIKEKRLVAEDWFLRSTVQSLLRNFGGSDYYRAVLQNLFFAALNTPMDQRGFSTRRWRTHRVFTRFRYRSLIGDATRFEELMALTPFVNGGLFDCLDDEKSRSAGGKRYDMFTDPDPADGPAAAKAREEAWRELDVPDSLFFDEDGLFPLLNRFKFTVEENTPVEMEVALDPELLGRVFENLLAFHNPETRERVRDNARKRTGSFYTPRKIVDYLVDQALVPTIAERAQPADGDDEFWSERLQYLLDYEDAGELFEPEDALAVIRAVSELRVLDPAVGSGAFPMAVLHKLTLALRRLDPENKMWRDLQKERAMVRAEGAFHDKEKAERDAELLEISTTFERYSGDFGRKLYLIQNGIFGVDIQSIACQIAKLRFFISLAIEQDADPDASNLGFRPLPNLETRFVAAQTLLPLENEAEGMLKGRAVEKIEDRLDANRERHFHATTRRAKLDCQQEDRELRRRLATALKKTGFPAGAARRLAQWDPYDQNASVDWFDADRVFGIRDGFDVVLGNPPYVRADFDSDAHREARQRILESGRYETLWEKWDLYVAFIERGCKLLRPGGILSFIVSDAYCHAKYALKSREWLLEEMRVLRVDFLSDIKVFDAAVHNVCLAVQKADGTANEPERRVHEDAFGNARALGTGEQRRLTERMFFPEDLADFSVTVPTVSLDRICYVSVGMVVHADEKRAPGAFRMEDLVADSRTGRCRKPFVEGKHLARWLPASVRWLEWGTDRAPGLFRRPTFPEMYDVEEKLIAQRSPGPDPLACYDPRQLRFPESVVGFVPWHSLAGVRNRSIRLQTRYAGEKPPRPDLPGREDLEETSRRFEVKFLLGIMNSSWARAFLLAHRRSNIHLYPNDWKKLPVPDCDRAGQEPVVEIVERILAVRADDADADMSSLEAELDGLVYGLYGLSEEEIGAVEGGR